MAGAARWPLFGSSRRRVQLPRRYQIICRCRPKTSARNSFSQFGKFAREATKGVRNSTRRSGSSVESRHLSAFGYQVLGTTDNSPAIYRWERRPNKSVQAPPRAKEIIPQDAGLFRPWRALFPLAHNSALKRWAIVFRPAGLWDSRGGKPHFVAVRWTITIHRHEFNETRYLGSCSPASAVCLLNRLTGIIKSCVREVSRRRANLFPPK
jgi:hypothetical protein